MTELLIILSSITFFFLGRWSKQTLNEVDDLVEQTVRSVVDKPIQPKRPTQTELVKRNNKQLAETEEEMEKLVEESFKS